MKLLKFKVTIFIIVAFSFFSQAQFINNDWKWGRNYQDTSSFPWGGTTLTFASDTFTISEEQNRSMNIKGTYSGLGTSDGEYFIYTNGYTICNKNHDTITNGDGLTPGGNASIFELWGIPSHANAVILPYPGSDRLMVMISMDNYYYGSHIIGKNIYYNLIDPSGNNGQGIVMIKNQVVVTDTFDGQGLSVVKHANGRDWWIFAKRGFLNDFFALLLNSNGISFQGLQSLGGPVSIGGGGVKFSHNGGKFACFSNKYQLRLYDFDRCSGLLSNMRYKFITGETAGGVAFSPDSRYLYICKWDSLWQFDMEAPDIMASQTFIDRIDLNTPDPVTGLISGWAYMYLANDNKIYLQNFSGVMLNVINNPDMPGQACNFVQNQIQCPTYYYSTVPTYVNLNLMQEHGSVCDSLGVGNEELQIKNYELTVYPNPATDKVLFTFNGNTSASVFTIHAMNGAVVYSTTLNENTNQLFLDVSNFSKGVYVAHFVSNESSTRIKFIVNK